LIYWLPFILILLPLSFAVVSYFMGKINRSLANYLVVIVNSVVFVGTIVLVKQVLEGKVFSKELFGILLRVDEMAVIMAFVTSALWLMASIYSIKYMEGKNNLDRYYTAYLLTYTGCLGVAFSGGILELLVFFEVASLVPYILIVHSHSSQSHKAASKYLYMCIIGGLLVFYGTVVTFWFRGTGDFQVISRAGGMGIPASAVVAFLIGFGIKGGLVPVHSWLPDAHSVAPSSVSSLLSGITVKVGMLSIIKLVYYIAPNNFMENNVWSEILLIVALLSIVFGSIMAIGQNKVKRMLAYSTISQMGYILLGIGFMNYRGLIGALYHFFSHSFMKGNLFLIAGAVRHKKNITHLEDFKGLGREMPVTMLCYSAAALSMVGIPLFSGFTSKWYIGLGSLDAGRPFHLGILLLSSLLNVIYFFPPAIKAFFPKESVDFQKKSVGFGELHPFMMVPIVILTLGVIYGGVFNNFVLRLGIEASARIFGN